MSYRVKILGKNCAFQCWTKKGVLLLANGDRYEVKTLDFPLGRLRSLTLREIAKLTFTSDEWLLGGQSLKGLRNSKWLNELKSSEGYTNLFTVETLYDAVNGSTRYGCDPAVERKRLEVLRDKVTHVAWVEELYTDYPGNEGEQAAMVPVKGMPGFSVIKGPHTPAAKGYTPILLSSFSKLTNPISTVKQGGTSVPGKGRVTKADEAASKRQRSSEESGVKPTPIPDYRITQESCRRRRGKHDRTVVSTWRIKFGSEEILMPALLATEYLVHLILHQGREFSASELTQIVRKSMPGELSRNSQEVAEILRGNENDHNQSGAQCGPSGDLKERDVIWDQREIDGCLRKVKALREAILEHEEAGDISSALFRVLKEKLEEQQDLLGANAKNVKDKWVPKEYQKSTFQEKANLIGKHVRKVLDEHLFENCRPLFDHLNDRNTLIFGVRNCYQPKPRVEWVVQLRGNKKGM